MLLPSISKTARSHSCGKRSKATCLEIDASISRHFALGKDDVHRHWLDLSDGLHNLQLPAEADELPGAHAQRLQAHVCHGARPNDMGLAMLAAVAEAAFQVGIAISACSQLRHGVTLEY